MRAASSTGSVIACWIALVWLGVALLRRWQVMFWLFQAMAVVGIGMTISACFKTEPYSPSLLSLPLIASQLAALAAFELLIEGLERSGRELEVDRRSRDSGCL